MKKGNKLTINTKFPFISKEKRAYLTIMKKRNTKSSILYKKHISLNKPLNSFKSVNLLETLTPFNKRNPLLKSFSLNNLYVTKLPSEERTKKSRNNYETFGLQIIPPNKKKRIFKLKQKKKVNYKELKYIGALLGLEEKKDEKDTERKYVERLETRKDYFNFITHKRNLFFNPNATSNYVHDKSSNYLISTITKTKYFAILNNKNKKQKDHTEELLELRDKVPHLSFEQEKMINQIKSLFSEDFKFNNMQLNEDFYQNNENRVNFLEDILRVPIIKNNLVKIKIDKNKSLGVNEWKNINVINHQTWNFLNQLKRKIQREKDEKNKKLKEYLIKKREEEKEYEILEKKNKGGGDIQKKDENEKKKEEEQLKNIMDDIIGKEEKKEQKFEDIYSVEEYFLRKNMYFSDNVSIASQRLRNIFFDNQ